MLENPNPDRRLEAFKEGIVRVNANTRAGRAEEQVKVAVQQTALLRFSLTGHLTISNSKRCQTDREIQMVFAWLDMVACALSCLYVVLRTLSQAARQIDVLMLEGFSLSWCNEREASSPK